MHPMKKIYALREMAFGYNDEVNYPIAMNKIYKNYDTLEAAQKAKNELHLAYYRLQIDIENLTKDYAAFIHNHTGINHLDFLKKQYSIDFEGALESEYLKDFKYKTFFGWLSVELFEAILEDSGKLLPLPKREPLHTHLQLAQYHYTQQKRVLMPLSWIVTKHLYPTHGRDGKYTDCWNKTGDEYYEYASTHFKIDFKAICASKYLKKFKYKKFFNELFNNFFWTLVSQSDEAILDWVEKGNLGVYEIMEATEKTVFYKIYTNPNFTDYKYHQVGANIESEDLWDQEPIFYSNQQAALQEMSRLFRFSITRYYGDTLERCLIGNLNDLSEMPVLLEAYIVENEFIKYDYEKKCLWMEHSEKNTDEIVVGLISLIRPAKLPYKLVEIPITQMKESYLGLDEEAENFDSDELFFDEDEDEL
jgi:hypothetical protein